MHPAVQDHVHDLAAEYVLEIRVPLRFRARDNEDQTSQGLPSLGEAAIHRTKPLFIRSRRIDLPQLGRNQGIPANGIKKGPDRRQPARPVHRHGCDVFYGAAVDFCPASV